MATAAAELGLIFATGGKLLIFPGTWLGVAATSALAGVASQFVPVIRKWYLDQQRRLEEWKHEQSGAQDSYADRGPDADEDDPQQQQQQQTRTRQRVRVRRQAQQQQQQRAYEEEEERERQRAEEEEEREERERERREQGSSSVPQSHFQRCLS